MRKIILLVMGFFISHAALALSPEWRDPNPKVEFVHDIRFSPEESVATSSEISLLVQAIAARRKLGWCQVELAYISNTMATRSTSQAILQARVSYIAKLMASYGFPPERIYAEGNLSTVEISSLDMIHVQATGYVNCKTRAHPTFTQPDS